MSETKFTKGKFNVIGDELRFINNAECYAVIQTDHAAIDIIAPGIMASEHMANAQLFAAAPDLYEALVAAKEIILMNAPHDMDPTGEAWKTFEENSPKMRQINAALALVTPDNALEAGQ